MGDDPRRDAYKAARRRGLSPDEAMAEAMKVAIPTTSTALTPPTGEDDGLAEKAWNNAGRPALQGVTLGFSDELRGLGAALIPGGDDYTTARDKERAALDRAYEEAPILSRVAEGIGGLATPVGAFGKLAKGAGTLAKVKLGAKVGATAGALGGVGIQDSGEGEIASPGDLVAPAAIGGTIGGVVGTIGPAVTGGARALSRLGEKLGEEGALMPESLRALAKALGVTDDQMADGLERSGLRDAIEGSRAARGLPVEGMGPKGPTPRTRQFPPRTGPTRPAPTAPPTPPTPATAPAEAVSSAVVPQQPSAAETARRIQAATSGGLPNSARSMVSQPPSLARAVADQLDPPSSTMLPETVARKQRGPTRSQLQFREERFGLPQVTPDPPQGAPLAPAEEMDLVELLRQSILESQQTGRTGSLWNRAVRR